ncbi:MAG: Gfo/Idh/MocA family oxidoreductase [Bacteroidota bacterium]
MKPVRVGIVGLGWVAQVVHLPILLRLPEAVVASICDRDRSRARLVGEKFGIKNVYTDLASMLAGEEFSVLIVATSTDAHREVTLAGLDAGRDVLVEKPIGRNYAEAVEMAEAARKAERKLMVGMNHRFRPDAMILKSFIEGKEIGRVFFTKAGWLRKRNANSPWSIQKERSGGGAFMDLGIVLLDLTLWMLGYPAVRKVHAAHYANKTRGVEDTSLVTVTMKNESQVRLEVSWSLPVDGDISFCEFFGTEGSASLNPLRMHKELHGNVVNMAPAKVDTPANLFRRSYENELKHFLGAVSGLHPVISTADEAVQRMRVVDAIYRSARSGNAVRIA